MGEVSFEATPVFCVYARSPTLADTSMPSAKIERPSRSFKA
jgi:hypothetical protein